MSSSTPPTVPLVRTPTPTSSTGVAPTSPNNASTRSPSTPQPHPKAAQAQAPPSSNPKVAELQVMFPTVDVTVIEMILESCGNSQDRAIEQLLSMTDPEFKPDELHAVRTEESSQLDLDAQFARSLQMQDEEEARRQQAAYNASQGGGGVQQPGQLPYQPRVRKPRGPTTPTNQPPANQSQGFNHQEYQLREDGQNPPGMLAMEDKLNQYAEVGKQTFNSLLAKAKAKYSEYQASQAQGQAQQGSRGSRAGLWGNNEENSARGGYSGQVPGGGRGGQQNYQQQAPRGGGNMWEEERSLGSRDSFRSASFSSASEFDASQPQPVIRQSSNRWQPSDAFDDPFPASNRIEITGRKSPAVGSPEKPITGKIDPAKLGILPKKRVDLLSTSPNASTSHVDDHDPNPSLPSGETPHSLVSKIPPTPPATSPYKLEDSDDELEYTKNPFDEK